MERLQRDLVPEGFRDSCPCSTWIPPSPGVTAFPGRYSKPPTEQRRNKGIMSKLLPLYTTDNRCNILKKRKKSVSLVNSFRPFAAMYRKAWGLR